MNLRASCNCQLQLDLFGIRVVVGLESRSNLCRRQFKVRMIEPIRDVDRGARKSLGFIEPRASVSKQQQEVVCANASDAYCLSLFRVSCIRSQQSSILLKR